MDFKFATGVYDYSSFRNPLVADSNVKVDLEPITYNRFAKVKGVEFDFI